MQIKFQNSNQTLFDVIYQLAKEKNKEALAKLMESGANIDFYQNMRSPIMLLAKEGDKESVVFLSKEFNASLNQAVVGSAEAGHIEITLYLIERGADVDPAVCSSAESGHVDLTNILLKLGASLNSALNAAAAGGHVALINDLIKRGAKPCYAGRAGELNRYLEGKSKNVLGFISSIDNVELRKNLIKEASQNISINVEEFLTKTSKFNQIMRVYNINFDQAHGFLVKGAPMWLRQEAQMGANFHTPLPRDIFVYITSYVLGLSNQDTEVVSYSIKKNREHYKKIAEIEKTNKKTPGTFFTNVSLKLPQDFINKISSKLNPRDLNQLALTCKGVNSLFKKPLADAKLPAFLELVAFGMQYQAEKMLKSDFKLLFEKGTVTDYSGRTFENITAFQYALWALDRYMWTMILKYLPKEEAMKQLYDHVYHDKAYKALHGVHFDFSPLINKLQVYADTCAEFDNKWYGSYWRRRESYWIREIGGEQRLVPVHVSNEYCQGRSFDPLPEFKEDNLYRIHTFNDHMDDEPSTWFPLSSNMGLGFDFGISRHNKKSRAESSTTGPDQLILMDINALIKLHEVRTECVRGNETDCLVR